MRLWRRRRAAPAPSYADDGTLDVLVRADDPAVADSTLLADVDLTAPVLLRHHLLVPDTAREELRALVAQDGYAVTDVEPGRVRVWRTQVLTPLAAAQERSRMAGLAQRLGGDVDGYDVSAPR